MEHDIVKPEQHAWVSAKPSSPGGSSRTSAECINSPKAIVHTSLGTLARLCALSAAFTVVMLLHSVITLFRHSLWADIVLGFCWFLANELTTLLPAHAAHRSLFPSRMWYSFIAGHAMIFVYLVPYVLFKSVTAVDRSDYIGIANLLLMVLGYAYIFFGVFLLQWRRTHSDLGVGPQVEMVPAVDDDSETPTPQAPIPVQEEPTLFSWMIPYVACYLVATRTIAIMKRVPGGVDLPYTVGFALIPIMCGIFLYESRKTIVQNVAYLIVYFELANTGVLMFVYILGVEGSVEGTSTSGSERLFRSVLMSVWSMALRLLVKFVSRRMTASHQSKDIFRFQFFIYLVGDVFQSLLLVKGSPSALSMIALVCLQQVGSSLRSLGFTQYLAWKVLNMCGLPGGEPEKSPYSPANSESIQALFLMEHMGNYSEVMSAVVVPLVLVMEYMVVNVFPVGEHAKCVFNCIVREDIPNLTVFIVIAALRLAMIPVERRVLDWVCSVDAVRRHLVALGLNDWVGRNAVFVAVYVCALAPQIVMSFHLARYGYV